MGKIYRIPAYFILTLFLGVLNHLVVAVNVEQNEDLYYSKNLNGHLKESNGVLMGEFLYSYTKLSKNSEVITDLFFKINRSVGIPSKDIKNSSEFKVFIEGGNSWHGEELSSVSVPKFEHGKKYVLILIKGEFGYQIYGNGLATYELKGHRENRELISYFDPDHPSLGVIAFDQFNEQLFLIYNEKLTSEYKALKQNIYQTPASRTKKARGLASIYENENSKNSKIVIFWPVVIFALLGLAYNLKNKFKT